MVVGTFSQMLVAEATRLTRSLAIVLFPCGWVALEGQPDRPQTGFTEQRNLLPQQPKRAETDERTRDRLTLMADHYAHLAESRAQSEANPPDVASLGDIFTKGG